jgi:hypothetical protein
MASIRKHRDKWQAQIRLRGIKPVSKTFPKRAQAVTWAQITESEILRSVYVDPRPADSVTISDLLERYLDELPENSSHLGPKCSRCKRLSERLGRFSLGKLSATHLAEYRDHRALTASPMTIIHELSLLHRVLVLATTEWDTRCPAPSRLCGCRSDRWGEIVAVSQGKRRSYLAH